MSKQMTLIIAAVVILLIVGVAGFTLMRNNLSSPAETAQVKSSPTSTTNAQTSPTKGTLQSLISGGQNLSCEINMEQGGGTTYVSGKKMRGDFTVDVDGKQMLSHMIGDGEFMFMWTDGVSQGTKFKIDPNSPRPSVSASGQAQVADLNQEVDLKCNPWTPDPSKFVLPAGVTFADMSQMLQSLPSAAGSGNPGVPSVDKSICDQITDPAGKAACLKAVGN